MTATDLPVLNEENAPPGTPLRPYTITYTAEKIQEYLDRTGESGASYVVDGKPCVPPVLLLACYARLIHDTFFYETGVHVSSDMTIHRLPWQDEPVNVHGSIKEHFERNGSKYVRFSVEISAEDGGALVDIEHVSIYKLRPRHER